MKRRFATCLCVLLATNLSVVGAAHGQSSDQLQYRVDRTEQGNSADSEVSIDENLNGETRAFYKQLEEHELSDQALWFIVLAASGAGAFGGFVYHLINFKEIRQILEDEAKRKGKDEIDRKAIRACCASHMSIGAAAAPAAILLLRPETAFAFIAMSIVAGSAGSAAFRNIQDKIMANVAVARADADTAKEKQEKEKAEHDRTKAIHHAVEHKTLRLNKEQSDAIGRLLEITESLSPEPKDWSEVKAIAKKLQGLCRECRNTLENPETTINNHIIPQSEESSTTPVVVYSGSLEDENTSNGAASHQTN